VWYTLRNLKWNKSKKSISQYWLCVVYIFIIARIKKEKDIVENQLSHTTKELEIARKESHIPRSPTR